MIFEFASRLRRTPGFGWAFSILSFLVALGIRFAVTDLLPNGFPFLTFFPAVMLTTFFGGRNEGILCAVLSTVAAWYWFIDPARSFTLDPQGLVALGFFVGVMILDIAIIHTMNESVAAAGNQRREAERLADERRTLFQELQHRIANNLAFVSSLLSIHARRHRDNPAVAADFADVRQRLETLSQVHRRLYDPEAQSRTIGGQLQAICNDLVRASGVEGVDCTVVADEFTFPVDRLMTLSLVTNELVSNALKHAFVGRSGGRIEITLRRIADNRAELKVADDGPGLPEGFDPEKGDRLGHRIVAGFVRTLNGEIAYATDGGAVTRLSFPLL